MLTTPTADSFAVSVTRTDGEVVFTGEATVGRDGHRLSLRDVGPERFSTRLEGVVTNDSVKLTLMTWQGPARRKNHGRAIQPAQ